MASFSPIWFLVVGLCLGSRRINRVINNVKRTKDVLFFRQCDPIATHQYKSCTLPFEGIKEEEKHKRKVFRHYPSCSSNCCFACRFFLLWVFFFYCCFGFRRLLFFPQLFFLLLLNSLRLWFDVSLVKSYCNVNDHRQKLFLHFSSNWRLCACACAFRRCFPFFLPFLRTNFTWIAFFMAKF